MTYLRLKNTNADATITLDCTVNHHAIGGGGEGDSSVGTGGNHIANSYPSNSTGTAATSGSTNSRYWTVVFGGSSINHYGWVVCEPD